MVQVGVEPAPEPLHTVGDPVHPGAPPGFQVLIRECAIEAAAALDRQ